MGCFFFVFFLFQRLILMRRVQCLKCRHPDLHNRSSSQWHNWRIQKKSHFIGRFGAPTRLRLYFKAHILQKRRNPPCVRCRRQLLAAIVWSANTLEKGGIRATGRTDAWPAAHLMTLRAINTKQLMRCACVRACVPVLFCYFLAFK